MSAKALAETIFATYVKKIGDYRVIRVDGYAIALLENDSDIDAMLDLLQELDPSAYKFCSRCLYEDPKDGRLIPSVLFEYQPQ